jgi:hypothetical protein
MCRRGIKVTLDEGRVRFDAAGGAGHAERGGSEAPLEDAAPPAALVCFAGLLVERWLFFAEARHTVNLYQKRL